MREHIEWQQLHELLKELAQKEYGDKYGEQIFWYFQDVVDDSCKLDVLEEENKRLHSIIKEVRKYIKDEEKEGSKLVFRYEDGKYYEAGILEILDKVKE